MFVFISTSYEDKWSYDWSEIRKPIKDSIQLIESDDFISTGVKGIAGKEPKQFKRRFWVMQNATKEELTQLIKYPNGTVKCVAYEGLLRRFNTDVYNIFKSVLNEKTEITSLYGGCEGYNTLIAEYLIGFIYGHYFGLAPPFHPRSPLSTKLFNLTDLEKNQIIDDYKELIDNKEKILTAYFK
ncbi:MAG: hypothetical protein ABJL44_12900 [Algibacter sp.]